MPWTDAPTRHGTSEVAGDESDQASGSPNAPVSRERAVVAADPAPVWRLTGRVSTGGSGSSARVRVSLVGQNYDEPIAEVTCADDETFTVDLAALASLRQLDLARTKVAVSACAIGHDEPLPIRLPGGGYARICTERDTWPDGTDFVGVGIEPDVSVPATVEDLRKNHDRTLDVAIEHLRSRLSP